MDYLVSAIKSLNAKEIKLLNKKIHKQDLKLRLMEILTDDEHIDNKDLIQRLDSHSYGSIYTLKNRLLDDIITVKFEVEKNEYVQLSEQVQNLRALVYARDHSTLLRELKKLEKKCHESEMYQALKEINFCYMLCFRHSKSKVAHYRSRIRYYEERENFLYYLEEVFYTRLLDTQDLFYYPNNKIYIEEAEKAIYEIEGIHKLLNSRASQFLFLSARLTYRLSFPIENNSDRTQLLKELIELKKGYANSYLVYRYPHCEIAIQSLFSKFYFQTGDLKKFSVVQQYIYQKTAGVTGHQMFECTLFYYTYVSIKHQISSPQMPSFTGIEKTMELTADNIKSTKVKMYFDYAKAVMQVYKQNYSKSSSILLTSRNDFKTIDQHTYWVALENVLLNVFNCVKSKDFMLINTEINLVKRILSRFDVNPQLLAVLKILFAAVKQAEYKDEQLFVAQALRLQKEFGLFGLINFNYTK